MVSYTNDDVIAYIYNELPIASQIAFENELDCNWALREKVQTIKEVKLRLQNYIAPVAPSQSCVDSIMKYATATIVA